MDRCWRYLQAFHFQQIKQLACSPIGTLPAQLGDTSLDPFHRAARRVLRSTTLLPDPLHTNGSIPTQPVISGRPRNSKLPAKLAHALLPFTGGHDKPNSLFLRCHHPPSHLPTSTAR